MHELLDAAIRVNLALAAAIALILALRAITRRLFGARVAYALWAAAPIAAAAALLPTRTVEVQATAPPIAQAITAFPINGAVVDAAAHPATTTPIDSALIAGAGPLDAALISPAPSLQAIAPAGSDWPALLLALWIGGAAASLTGLLYRQRRYVRSLGGLEACEELGARVYRAGALETGPAVVGVFNPFIVTPPDFQARYDARERAAVLAHERAHLRRGDPAVNAAMALAQSILWFNPFVHLATRTLRVDQELACDESVIAANASARRVYAEAMLKAQPGLALGPLGCAWPDTDFHRLKERIAMLKRTPPSRSKLWIGGSLVALATLAIGAGAWTAQPARVVLASADDTILEGGDPHEHDDRSEELEALHERFEDDVERAVEAAEAGRDLTDDEREALHESARAIAEAHRMSDSEIAAIREEARAAAEAHRMSESEIAAIRAQALAGAREALASSRAAHAEAMRGRHAEIAALTMSLTQRALQLAEAELSDGGMSAAQRARLESEIEADAERIAAWAERFEDEFDADDVDVDLDLDLDHDLEDRD